MAPTFGYWKLRGLAEPIRYLLHFVGVKYNEENYHLPLDYDKSDWFKVKFTKGLDFPNLPYYIDGDVKITQSKAILRYLARHHGLMVTSEKGLIEQDVVEQQASDLIVGLNQLAYDPNFENRKGDYIKDLLIQLKMFSDFLGKKQWMMGEKLTYVDFLVFEAIDLNRFLAPECLDSFPNLEAYVDRFENLPPISSYRASSAFVKYPIYGPAAYFGGK